MKKSTSKKASLLKSIMVGVIALLVMLVFAYGFQSTKVNLEELRSEQRQTSLQRVIRALAHPDIFDYDQVEVVINYPVYIPCHANGSLPAAPEQVPSEPYLIVTPGCANPGDTVQVEGFNFTPNVSGPVRFVPGSDPTYNVTLGREVAETDESGYFLVSMVLPERLSEDEQYIRATLRENVGAPYFSRTAKETWDKIIETVFMALLATTFGTILAIPLSFIAARNLMRSLKSPLASVSLSVIGWVVGIFIGYVVVSWIGRTSAGFDIPDLLSLFIILVVPILVWLVIRWALPQEEINPPSNLVKAARLVAIVFAVMISFFGLFELARLALSIGRLLSINLGSFGFLGNFLFQLGDIVLILTSILGALAAGGALSSFLGRLGQQSAEKLPDAGVKVLNLIVTPLTCAAILVLIGQLIEWLYGVGNPWYTLWGPLAVGVGIGLVLAILLKAKDSFPIGMLIYSITRTFLNGLRSVEALVMAIVFVIAVGIGPFAGALALGLHTIVSLAKLYSEQVESIQTGPLEAIQATGANRLQTIIYGVVPQIVPPYISYTMYRWDINVRMSTIIGFVGGGGIGFLLQQNINLLNYRGASVQMLAIAIVVASMDYISSVLREKTI